MSNGMLLGILVSIWGLIIIYRLYSIEKCIEKYLAEINKEGFKSILEALVKISKLIGSDVQ